METTRSAVPPVTDEETAVVGGGGALCFCRGDFPPCSTPSLPNLPGFASNDDSFQGGNTPPPLSLFLSTVLLGAGIYYVVVVLP